MALTISESVELNDKAPFYIGLSDIGETGLISYISVVYSYTLIVGDF